MRKKRLLTTVAAALAVAFALAGCSIIPDPFPQASPASTTTAAEPKVGQCWNATDNDADNWSYWEGSAATACSHAHELYTYSIGTITGITTETWAKAGDPSQTSAAVSAAAGDACSTYTLLPKLKWNQQLVQGYFFLPTEAQWKSGARWVRCDIGVLAYGATLENEVLAKLPAKISTLVSAVSSDPERYDFCVNSPVPVSESGPLDSDSGRIADCRSNPQWALVGRGDYPEVPGAPFPSSATANQESSDVCMKFVQNSNEVWIAYIPSKSDWSKTNDREIDCWVGQKATGGSGGTA